MRPLLPCLLAVSAATAGLLLAQHALVAQEPAAAAAAAHRSDVAAFVNVAVIPMDHERVLKGQTVVVRGDRIIQMGPVKQVRVPAGATQISGQGKYLIPGLADMHVHMAGVSDEEVEHFLLALVANGITTVRDMHSGGSGGYEWQGKQMLDRRERVARGELLGPRIYTSGDPDYSSPAAAAASVAKLKADGHNFIKVYGDVLSPEVYDSIKASADRVGIRMGGHVPRAVGLEWVLAARFASIEHMSRYAYYLVGLDRDTNASDRVKLPLPQEVDSAKLRAIAIATQRAGTWICPTLSAHKAFGSPLNLIFLIAKALYQNGVGLLTGTDLAGTENILQGYTILGELDLLVHNVGLTPYQALETSTWNIARFLGTTDSTGTVAVGKRADLVLLEANPLLDIGNVRKRAGVMVGGRWLPQAELRPTFAGDGTNSVTTTSRRSPLAAG